jgi:sugar lactone lactonase YvrE
MDSNSDTPDLKATVLVEGLHFGECPRWRGDRLWFSDFFDHSVSSVSVSGDLRQEVAIDDQPAGLGWTPEGNLLVVGMRSRQVFRHDSAGFAIHSDIGQYTRHRANDMIVDRVGRAFVGSFGFDLDLELQKRGPQSVMHEHPKANLVRVDVDGTASVAAEGLSFPNGMVLTPDERTLVVAETLGLRLTAFDVGNDGSLSNRRKWADVGMRAADGISLGRTGRIWVANAMAPECVLLEEGGTVAARVSASQNCFACALGGPDMDHLFIMTAPVSQEDVASRQRDGRMEVVALPTELA